MRNVLKKTKIILIASMWMIASLQAIAQGVQVRGKVTDASTGEALPGVNVVLKGTTVGTASTVDGQFSINAPKGSTLVFSFIGYVSQEIEIADQTELSISLNPETTNINEVVVIGYGTVKKSDATGSVAVVSADDFNKGSITSPQQLLVGKTAGVVITSNGGAPGSGSTIRIRGGSSLSASNDPLIVIDGVPIENSGPSGMGNSLNVVNPNDIASMTILKDASATAIYGSRASNGVIIITTKKGGSKFKVTYYGSLTAFTIPKVVDVLSGDEFRSLVYDLYGPASTAVTLPGAANTNWQKEIYKTAWGHDNNLSISGTTAKIPYRASVGYTNDDGILKTSNFKRTTASLGLDPTFLDDHLKVNANAKVMSTDTRFANEGAIGPAVTFDPTQSVYDASSANGYTFWRDNSGNPIKIATSNPVALLNLTSDLGNVVRSIGNLQLDYKFQFLPDLHANLNAGYDYSKSDGTYNVPESTSWTYDPVNGSGIAKYYNQRRKTELLDFYLNYTKELDAISSKIDFTAGYSWQHFWRKGKTYSTNVAETNILENSPYITQNYLVSFFGRMNYTLKDRYLLTFTMRDDGSSKFAEGNKWGLFPSVALAWKVKSESFLANVNAISDLKVRLGYGITGQQDIGSDFPYLPVYTYSDPANTAQYPFGGTFYRTLRPEGYDPNIKWEETTTYNAGIDFGFAKNRVTGSFDVYQRKTTDLLEYIPVSAGSNLSNYITTNVGDLENKGAELVLSVVLASTKDLSWSVSYNLGYNQNRITKLSLTNNPDYVVETGGISGGVGNKVQLYKVDYPKNTYNVYHQVYNQDGSPIEGMYVDKNNDGVINEKDKYQYQKPDPDYQMGISSMVNYKNWDFSFSGRLSIGNYVYNNVASTRGSYLDVFNSGLVYLSNVLKSSEKIKFGSAQYFSDYFVENASFFRMDNISLGYQFTDLWADKIKLHVSAVVQNAFVITKYTGLDPEVDGGIDNNFYPRPRSFMLGVKVDF